MADMSTKTTTNVRFSAHEVYNLNVSNSIHSPGISIMTTGSDSVEINFADRESMNKFIGGLVKAWVTIDRDREYSSGYSYVNNEDDRITYQQILEWKAAAERMEALDADIKATLDALKPVSE